MTSPEDGGKISNRGEVLGGGLGFLFLFFGGSVWVSMGWVVFCWWGDFFWVFFLVLGFFWVL